MLSERLKSLQSLSRKVCKAEKSVFDVVLFGSSIKEKYRPGDIDICIIFRQEMEERKRERIAEVFKGCHVEHLFLHELYKEPLWQTLIHEGFSLVKNKFVHEIFGFDSQIIFRYDLKKLDSVKKSMFSHALVGRDGEGGVLRQTKGIVLGKGCVMIPAEASEKIREFLETWGVEYSVMKALVS